MNRLIAAAALLVVTTTGASAALMGQGPTPVLVRGTVTSLTGQTLLVAGKTGPVTIMLAPDTKVAAVSVIGIDAIKPNSFIGTAAEPGKGGVLTATEVHVFPESMRGAGEGHRPWDLSKTSSMTNGNVRTVGAIKHQKGRTMVVDYKGGQQTVVVPASVPIVSFTPASMALVKPGARVFAITLPGPSGSRAANSLAVGVNGTVPPM